MRHRKAGRRLSRTTSHRESMLRNMVTSLFTHERIKTTDAKAKELRCVAEEMITLAKRGDLHARRQALAVIRDKKTVKKLFEDLRGRFVDRVGGYTCITKIGVRAGDAAPISLVELVAGDVKGEKAQAKKGKAKGPAKKTRTTKPPVAKSEGAKKTRKKKEDAEQKTEAPSS